MHKRLVAGLSGLVTCLQSNFIGTNFAGFCSNLGVRGLFSSAFVSYWEHVDWLAPGYLMGAGNPTISLETETQVPAACQPRQPHKCCVEEGIHRSRTPSQAYLGWSCLAASPVDSELSAWCLWERQWKDKTPSGQGNLEDHIQVTHC